MRRTVVWCFLMGMALLLAGCAPQLPPTPTPAPDLGLNLLVETKGDFRHKRPGWVEYLPLSFGTRLDRDDLLQAAPDAEGLIVCADLSLAHVSPGYRDGLPCPRATPVLTRSKSLILEPRRGEPPAGIPYILSPRRTSVMTAHPLLQWHPAGTGIITYTVSIRGKEGEWPVTETVDIEVVYADHAPPLVPGTRYTLLIKDDQGHSSEQEDIPLDLGFELLPAEEVRAVQELEAQIHGLPLSEPAVRFLVSELYASRGLRADAIAVLKALVTDLNQPGVHRRLGDLYLEVGLYFEAVGAYEQARAGFQALGDRAGEAAALVGLGRAYWRDGNKADAAKALDYLEGALEIYQVIGDEARVKELENETTILSK